MGGHVFIISSAGILLFDVELDMANTIKSYDKMQLASVLFTLYTCSSGIQNEKISNENLGVTNFLQWIYTDDQGCFFIKDAEAKDVLCCIYGPSPYVSKPIMVPVVRAIYQVRFYNVFVL
jgi:hypothetical protein